MTRQGLGRRFTALLAAIALHFLFVLLLLMRDPLSRMTTIEARPSLLFFIEVPPPRATPLPATQPSATPRAPTVIDDVNSPEPSPIVPLSDNPPTSVDPKSVDWNAQASEAAVAVVDRAIRQETRKCDPADAPNSFLPSCKPRSHEFEWNPEEPRVGFSGGLPYVRIGERCAIGLGFFACGFGAKPPANGELFEHMNDPERERGSVPSSDPSTSQRN